MLCTGRNVLDLANVHQLSSLDCRDDFGSSLVFFETSVSERTSFSESPGIDGAVLFDRKGRMVATRNVCNEVGSFDF